MDFSVIIFPLELTRNRIYTQGLKLMCINQLEKYIFMQFVASELNDPIWLSSEWQIGSFSSEATNCLIELDMDVCGLVIHGKIRK